MLVDLVEEMTCKWERQLEDLGESKWSDGMLAREGTAGAQKGQSIVKYLFRRRDLQYSPYDALRASVPGFTRDAYMSIFRSQ